jgi:hypothetical protein
MEFIPLRSNSSIMWTKVAQLLPSRVVKTFMVIEKNHTVQANAPQAGGNNKP